MKKFITKLGKNLIINIIAFSIIVGSVALAVSFPTTTPTGQIPGGKFMQYFNNMKGSKNCDDGEAVVGFNNDFTKICKKIVSTTYTYSWELGIWSPCSVTCLGGTKTRTIICKRDDGTTVADNLCTTLKPSTSEICNTGACVIPFTCGNDIIAGGFTYTTKLAVDGKCWTSTNMKHTPTSGNSRCYNSTASNCNTHGRLYNWTAATHSSVCGVLGTGWALPTDAQLTTLTNAGATGWQGNKINGLVNTLPGYLHTDGNFYTLGNIGVWWSSTESDSTSALIRILYSTTSTAPSTKFNKNFGLSVICIKN